PWRPLLDSCRRWYPHDRAYGAARRFGRRTGISAVSSQRSPPRKEHGIMTGTTTPTVPVLAGDQALTIAQADAVRAYGDLSAYSIRLVLEEDGWHVDYELKNPKLKGGGPHYLIDRFTGTILARRYDQ